MSSKKVIVAPKYKKMPISKRTSQGIDNKPKNKHKRKNFKHYVGQGKIR